ncbi:MAG: hypothetical protein JXM72_00180, partial [Deltaproteobacteria bacterium]|nr:hypothetical protein [Deltaproteobacteria bacterium]
GGRLSHNIGRNASDGTVETTGMKTCTGCHLDGQYSKIRKGMPEKAPSPLIAHADTFYNASFHLRLLACTACHVTGSPARGAYLLDLSTGKPLWYTAESMQAFTERASAAGPASNPWKPWIAVLDLKGTCGERYVPVAMHTAQWFGETGSDGIVRPIGTDTVYKAFEQTKGITSISVFNTAGKSIRRKTAATENDIAGVLKSLKRLGKANPVFVSDKIYAYEKGRIIKTDLPFETTLNLPIWHNVSPISKKQTLGAKGCLDCHDKKSLFFNKLKIVNIGRFLKEDYPEPKKPNAVPQMSEWGYKRVPSHD